MRVFPVGVMMKGLAALPVCFLVVSFRLAFVIPAIAQDVTLVGEVPFSDLDGSTDDADGTADGVFTIEGGGLTLDGTLHCRNDALTLPRAPCRMILDVAGDLTVTAGGAIVAEAGDRDDAYLLISVGGDVFLKGAVDETPGAVVSARGSVTLAVTGDIHLARGSRVQADTEAADARLEMLSRARVNIEGRIMRAVHAEGTRSGAELFEPPIVIRSEAPTPPGIVVGRGGLIQSKGSSASSQNVLLEAHGIELFGTVEGSGVAIRSSERVLVDGRDLDGKGARRGRVRAEAIADGDARVELLARRSVAVLGPEVFGVGLPPSSASAYTLQARTVEALALDSLSIVGRAIRADGGDIVLRAATDVELTRASLRAPDAAIVAHAFGGSLVWDGVEGDVRGLDVDGREPAPLTSPAAGAIRLSYCHELDWWGTDFPTPANVVGAFPEAIQDCTDASPDLASLVPPYPAATGTPVEGADLPPDGSVYDKVPGPCVDDVDLENQMVSGPSPELFVACVSLTAGNNFEILATADVRFRAGERIVLAEDFEIASGASFVAELDPTPNSAPVVDDQTFSVSEDSTNGAVLGTIAASDVDAGQTLSFQLLGGNPGGAFAVDSAGELSVANASVLDFETFPLFFLSVAVTDNGRPALSDLATIRVDILNANEPPTAMPDFFKAAGNTLLHAKPSGTVGSPPNGIAAATAAFGVLDNDVDPEGGLTAIPFSGTSNTSKGGDVTMHADGSFSYVPPPGIVADMNDPDTFDYVATDGTFQSMSTVSIEIVDLIWYVENDASPGGDGRSTSPFDALGDAETSAGVDETIFVHRGDGTTTGQDEGIALANGQKLLGEALDLVVDLGEGPITLLSGSVGPVLTNTVAATPGVTLANDNEVSGLTVDGADGDGIFGQDVEGALSLRSTTVQNNAGRALFVDNDNGGSPLSLAIDADGSTFAANAGGAISIRDNVTADVTIDGTSISGSTGIALELVDTTGNVTLATSTVTVTGGQLFRFSGTNGTFDLSGAALAGDDSASALMGSVLESVVGTYTFGDITMQKLGAAGFVGPGVAVTSSPGVGAAFGTVTLADVTGHGIHLMNNAAATMSFTALDVDDASGNGIELDGNGGTLTMTTTTHITNTAGDAAIKVASSVAGYAVDFGATTIDDTNIGAGASADGIDLTSGNASASFTFDSLSVTTDGGSGLLANASGTVHIGGAANSVSATGGAAIDITGTTLGTGGIGVSFQSVTSSGSGGRGIHLDNVTGSFSATSGSLIGASGTAVRVNGGSSDVTYGGAITNTSGLAVEITSRSGGAIELGGNLESVSGGLGISVQNMSGGATATFAGATKTLSTGTSPAVLLANNAGASIDFTGGGLDIDTTNGVGFSATGGGTVQVTGSNNSIVSTTGIALNVSSTTIGSSGIHFESLSADGATSGIVLSNTGNLGGLDLGANGATLGDGGTIQNTTGDAIALSNTEDVDLRFLIIGEAAATAGEGPDTTVNISGDGISMSTVDDVLLDTVKIARTGGHGVEGTGVTNLTIQDSQILNAGTANEEQGLSFDAFGSNNLDGTVNILDTVVDGSYENNFVVQNWMGTLNLTVSGTTAADCRFSNTAGSPFGEDGLRLDARGSSNMTVLVDSCTFDDLESDGVSALAQENGGSQLDLTIQDSVFEGCAPSSCSATGSDNALSLRSGGSATLSFTLSSNTIEDANGSAIVVDSNNTSNLDGTIDDNDIGEVGVPDSGSTAARGIDLRADDNSTAVVAISNNSISGTDLEGILARAEETANLDLHVLSNTVATPDDDIGASGVDTILLRLLDMATLCVDIQSNDVGPASDPFVTGIFDSIFADQSSSMSFEIERLTLGSNNAAQAEAHIASENPDADSVGAFATGDFTGVQAGACQAP